MKREFLQFLQKIGDDMEAGIITIFDENNNPDNDSLTVFDMGLQYTVGKIFEANGGPIEIDLDDLPQMMRNFCGDDIENYNFSFFEWWRTVKSVSRILREAAQND